MKKSGARSDNHLLQSQVSFTSQRHSRKIDKPGGKPKENLGSSFLGIDTDRRSAEGDSATLERLFFLALLDGSQSSRWHARVKSLDFLWLRNSAVNNEVD
jgi:hypothetical protein